LPGSENKTILIRLEFYSFFAGVAPPAYIGDQIMEQVNPSVLKSLFLLHIIGR
jgi:hypothetical protein